MTRQEEPEGIAAMCKLSQKFCLDVACSMLECPRAEYSKPCFLYHRHSTIKFAGSSRSTSSFEVPMLAVTPSIRQLIDLQIQTLSYRLMSHGQLNHSQGWRNPTGSDRPRLTCRIAWEHCTANRGYDPPQDNVVESQKMR